MGRCFRKRGGNRLGRAALYKRVNDEKVGMLGLWITNQLYRLYVSSILNRAAGQERSIQEREKTCSQLAFYDPSTGNVHDCTLERRKDTAGLADRYFTLVFLLIFYCALTMKGRKNNLKERRKIKTTETRAREKKIINTCGSTDIVSAIRLHGFLFFVKILVVILHLHLIVATGRVFSESIHTISFTRNYVEPRNKRKLKIKFTLGQVLWYDGLRGKSYVRQKPSSWR